MAYDSNSDRVILFGGTTGQPGQARDSNETWAYDYNSNTWTNLSPARAPYYVEEFDAMVFDSRRNMTLLFGGWDGQEPARFNETWRFEYATNKWISVNQAGPPPLFGFDMAYDSQSDRVVLYGGWIVDASSKSWETWAYDGTTNTWTSMGFGPPGRAFHAMAYDSQSDRVVLFGGDGPDGPTNETWTYDVNTNTWTKMNPAIRPPALAYHAMAYDTQSDRTILFGGVYFPHQSQVISNETWAYDVEADNWTRLFSPSEPDPRGWQGMAYDLESDRAILFGGASNVSFYYNDTWALRYDQTYPSAPRNLEALPGNGRITLTWQSPEFHGGLAIDGYRIYRGIAAGGESLLATVGNVLTYTDTGLTNGVTYYYEMSAVNAVGEGARSKEAAATPSPPVDRTKPSVGITSPTSGAMVASTTVTISGTASDDIAVQKVELSTDGTKWILASGTTSWSGTLTLSKGPNTIYARATDTSGNTATTNVSVTVEIPVASAVGLPPTIIVAGLVVSVAVAAASLAAWSRRRGRRGQS